MVQPRSMAIIRMVIDMVVVLSGRCPPLRPAGVLKSMGGPSGGAVVAPGGCR